jgi:O-acetyl-ADP-ribose deacetylase (regulator of RNase III)
MNANLSRIRLIQGDITHLEVDVLVNAANSSLLGGGGVDGAIHRAAGPLLLQECRTLGGCPTGQARITGGYELKARYVVHTVGPVWQGGISGEAGKLASCYYQSMLLAVKHRCRTLAFPNISTGVFGYPKMEAARIALDTVRLFLEIDSWLNLVTFCCFDYENYSIYSNLIQL